MRINWFGSNFFSRIIHDCAVGTVAISKLLEEEDTFLLLLSRLTWR